jgi:hypothetical protein
MSGIIRKEGHCARPRRVRLSNHAACRLTREKCRIFARAVQKIGENGNLWPISRNALIQRRRHAAVAAIHVGQDARVGQAPLHHQRGNRRPLGWPDFDHQTSPRCQVVARA